MSSPVRFAVLSQEDVEHARREMRAMTTSVGFTATDAEAAVLTVSELANNLLRHTPGGTITLTAVQGPLGSGVQIESQDAGPGIRDVEQAMEDGFSTGTGLGGGLPGARRLMDEFTIVSAPSGTSITARKWPNPRSR